MLSGRPAPIGPARRGAKPDPFPLAVLDDPGLSPVLAEPAAVRADAVDADTVNRELSIARKAIGWWLAQGWIAVDCVSSGTAVNAEIDLAGYSLAEVWST
ncbi:hypothetical protein OG609_06910 [Streptomyces sp. NBC_01224]|uniref:hypothetical protein n=1 Tax=Streptomyces sp. NBC_01224 TaxID=2903783 RepID=UPI002E0EFCFB|nr:hypothetical protein OG609_06910 [Streptomyces sp. NBC_01224]